jgi:hypothetical protein
MLKTIYIYLFLVLTCKNKKTLIKFFKRKNPFKKQLKAEVKLN